MLAKLKTWQYFSISLNSLKRKSCMNLRIRPIHKKTKPKYGFSMIIQKVWIRFTQKKSSTTKRWRLKRKVPEIRKKGTLVKFWTALWALIEKNCARNWSKLRMRFFKPIQSWRKNWKNWFYRKKYRTQRSLLTSINPILKNIKAWNPHIKKTLLDAKMIRIPLKKSISTGLQSIRIKKITEGNLLLLNHPKFQAIPYRLTSK